MKSNIKIQQYSYKNSPPRIVLGGNFCNCNKVLECGILPYLMHFFCFVEKKIKESMEDIFEKTVTLNDHLRLQMNGAVYKMIDIK